MRNAFLVLRFACLLFLLPFILTAQLLPFSDKSVDLGIDTFGFSKGIAIGDYNNDGFEDLYITLEQQPNKLFLNNGDTSYTEVAALLGLDISNKTTTAIWGDLNNDGLQDLYVGRINAPDQLFLNLGDGNFEDITRSAGIYNLGYPNSVNMADVNLDGFLDIYIANFSSQNILYLNQQNLTFKNATLSAGLVDKGSSMGAIFFDYDKDGDPDLYLVHDHAEPNFLYKNDGAGRFVEVGKIANANVQGLGMGVDIADINNDGYSDLYITNLYKNTMLLNQGDGTFKAIGDSAKTADNGMGWGTTFLDYDSDTQMDLIVANDSDFSEYTNKLYRNNGTLSFDQVEKCGGIDEWGQSFSIVSFDYDLDGYPDIGLANRGASDLFRIYQNNLRTSNWIGFKLIGVASNRDAIGARIQMEDQNNNIYYKEITAGHGWASQNSRHLLFGLGDLTQVKNCTIFWPSGWKQKLEIQQLNQYYTITEGEAPLTGIRPSSIVSKVQPSPKKIVRNFRIFPNPKPTDANLQIEIRVDIPGTFEVEIFDLLGRLIYTQKMELNFPGTTLHRLEIPPKIKQKQLIIRLRNRNNVSAQKLIMEP